MDGHEGTLREGRGSGRLHLEVLRNRTPNSPEINKYLTDLLHKKKNLQYSISIDAFKTAVSYKVWPQKTWNPIKIEDKNAQIDLKLYAKKLLPSKCFGCFRYIVPGLSTSTTIHNLRSNSTHAKKSSTRENTIKKNRPGSKITNCSSLSSKKRVALSESNGYQLHISSLMLVLDYVPPPLNCYNTSNYIL